MVTILEIEILQNKCCVKIRILPITLTTVKWGKEERFNTSPTQYRYYIIVVVVAVVRTVLFIIRRAYPRRFLMLKRVDSEIRMTFPSPPTMVRRILIKTIIVSHRLCIRYRCQIIIYRFSLRHFVFRIVVYKYINIGLYRVFF